MEKKIRGLKWTRIQSDQIDILCRICIEKHEGYLMQWTNMCDIYQEKLVPCSISARWKALNSTIEAELPSQLETISYGLENFLTTTIEAEKLQLSFMESEHGVKCQWFFECEKLPSDAFKFYFVDDILSLMNYLFFRNDKLLEDLDSAKSEEYQNTRKKKNGNAVFENDPMNYLASDKYLETLKASLELQKESVSKPVSQPVVKPEKKEIKTQELRQQSSLQRPRPAKRNLVESPKTAHKNLLSLDKIKKHKF